jgi:uncharacterized protein YgiM (DUF1202 family)
MPSKFRVLLFTIVIFIALVGVSFAQQETSSQWQINAKEINVRSDSTVTSLIICTLNKGEYVQVVSKAYEWYKIRLPKNAPSFIKKEFLTMLDNKTAKVSGDNVNIRLAASDSSAILGKVKENEVVSVLGESGDWFRIEPVSNSFGWVHSRFLKKLDKKDVAARAIKTEEEADLSKSQETQREEIAVQGVVRPKTIRRIATHKLITEDNSVFLLRGNKESLDALNYRKAKISGKRLDLPNQEYPIIEITKMEALD